MGFNVTSYLYSELEVERKAWERYGGPEAFEAMYVSSPFLHHTARP